MTDARLLSARARCDAAVADFEDSVRVYGTDYVDEMRRERKPPERSKEPIGVDRIKRLPPIEGKQLQLAISVRSY